MQVKEATGQGDGVEDQVDGVMGLDGETVHPADIRGFIASSPDEVALVKGAMK